MKEILGAIEFSDNEVRLIVGEFFKTRFNIIRVESEPCTGVIDYTISNKDEVKRAANAVISRASKLIGADVERLIVIIPAVGFKRYSLKVSVSCTNGIVTKEDTNRALNKAMKTRIDNNITIVNAVCVKYTCNGISSRRFPDREIADELIVDIDLLCADKAITFDYVSIIEELNLEVLDISLDIYAICKEAVLFERTVNQNIVLIKSDYQTTTLALLSKGKLYNVEILYDGLNHIYTNVYDKYALPFNVIDRLVKYNVKPINDAYSNDAIYAWRDNEGESKTISEIDLTNTVKDDIINLATSIKNACDPILASGLVSIIIVGEGAKVESFVQEIAYLTGVNVSTYVPETIGARNSSYSALLGSMYGYRDSNEFKERKVSSIDLYQFSELIEKKEDSEGESLTTRIRNLFQLKDRGGSSHE